MRKSSVACAGGLTPGPAEYDTLAACIAARRKGPVCVFTGGYSSPRIGELVCWVSGPHLLCLKALRDFEGLPG